MSQSLKIVIVGAGIGGLACAIASRRMGLDVIVLEKAEKLTAIGAGIQIPPNASRIWAQYGVIDQLKKLSVISEGTNLRRWTNGELLCTRDLGEKLDPRWPWLVIHRADYHRVLVEECERLGVDLKLGADVQDLHIETTKVTLRSGEMVSGDVIIGADGLWSTLRSQILGHPSPPQATSDLAYRGTFSRSSLQALDNPAIDKLCENNGSNMWLGPKGHAVFYPLRCGTQFNLVITCPDDLPPHVSTMEGDIEEMKAVFEGWDPVLTELLAVFPSVFKWKMMHHHELASWSKNNVSLLGDACHPSLPYQAQDAAMAVEDGAILGTLLSLYQEAHSQHAPHPTLPETLKLYESIQKLRTTTLHLGSISNRHYYQLEDGPEQEARDRKLKRVEWKELPEGESEDFIWIDVKYQKAVVCRDAIGDAKKKWEEIMEDAIRARGASDCPAATLSGWY